MFGKIEGHQTCGKAQGQVLYGWSAPRSSVPQDSAATIAFSLSVAFKSFDFCTIFSSFIPPYVRVFDPSDSRAVRLSLIIDLSCRSIDV